jgi:PAS domain S-box-containing protein
MAIPLRVLIVESQERDAKLLIRELEHGGYDVTYGRVDTAEAMSAALDREPWDIVISSYSLPRFNALEALALLTQRDLAVPVIIMSRTLDEDMAASALRVGVHDHLMKRNLTHLVPSVREGLRAVEERSVLRRAEEALRQSEERYRELVENANDVVFTIDLAGNFTSLNSAGEQISGYTRGEVVQMNMAQVLASESLDLAREMIRQKLADNRATTYELDMISKEGDRIPLEVSTRLIYHQDQPIGVQGIARDIRERKEAAAALRESEARYRVLFENASDIVYTHDLSGNFTSVNSAVERVLGYTRDEILQRSIDKVVAAEHLERARSMIRQKLQSAGPTTYELNAVTKAGRRVTLEINSQLISEGEQPVGVQGIARDVTERRRAEEELRAKERKQAAVADLGQRALANADLNKVFDDAVRCAVETLDVEFCTVTELLPDDNLLVARAGVGWRPGLVGSATVEAGAGSQAGFTLLSSEPVVVEDFSKETRFRIPRVLTDHGVTSGVSVIVHGHEHPFGVLSAFTARQRTFTQDDIHFLQAVANVLATAIERKRLEDERTKHSMELATRVLQAQEEERKRIARELHDETAQSLSTLLINLDLLEPYVPEEARTLKEGFRRVGALARRTLDETRALSHDLRPTILDDVGLVAALSWFAGEFQRTFETVVEVAAEPQPGLTPEAEVALFRIAQEALTNTGKHAGAEEATISLTFGDRSATLIIEDDGAGFDLENVPGPTREGRLGLYGMQERAALFGGTLTFDTAPGKGTRVTVDLPLERVLKPEEPAPVIAPEHSPV